MTNQVLRSFKVSSYFKMLFIFFLELSVEIALVKAFPNLTQNSFHPPKLYPEKDEHIVQVPHSWKIRCSGKYPLEWVLPTSPLDQVGRVKITSEVIPGNNPRPHLLHLEISNLKYYDTGRYLCRYNGTGDKKTSENSISTYLYASDDENLLTSKSKVLFVNVPQTQESIIDCRPTSPDVNMAFTKGGQNITNQLGSLLLKYDPKVGIIIQEGRVNYHSGPIDCHATKGDVKQFIHAYLTYKPVLEDLARPDINALESAKYPVIGDNITLECSTRVEIKAAHLELQWGFPDEEKAQKAISEGRITVMKQERLAEKESTTRDRSSAYINNAETVRYSKKIHISSLQRSDIGDYTCKVSSGSAQSITHIFSLVNVRESEQDPFIDSLEFSGHPVISIDDTFFKKSIQWIFKIFATPDPVYVWLDSTGKELDYTSLEKYEMSVDQKTGDVKLVINDVDLYDTGHYVFRVEVKGIDRKVQSRDVDLYLKYNRDPRVILSSQTATSGGYYLKNSHYLLVCEMEGFPLMIDESHLTFQSCSKRDRCDGSVEKFTFDFVTPDDNGVDDRFHYRYSSGVNITAEKSGIFECNVCRQFDPENPGVKPMCNSSTLEFFVTEFIDGFAIDDSTKTKNIIIEGDEVEYECGASMYDYRSVEWFKKDVHKRGDEMWIQADHIPTVKVRHKETKLSIVKTLSFPSISKQDDGIYVCRADFLGNSSSTSKEQRVFVVPPKAPIPTPTYNLTNTSTVIEMSTGIRLDCSTEGHPTPTYTWLRDGNMITTKFLANSSYVQMSEDGSVLNFIFALPQHSGKYECVAKNRAGTLTNYVDLIVEESYTIPKAVIGGIISGIAVFLVLIGLLAWKLYHYNKKYQELTNNDVKKFKDGDPSSISSNLGIGEQAELLPYKENYEFPIDKLELGKQLGAGAFGRVVKAKAFGILPWEKSTEVAVKMINRNVGGGDVENLKALMIELKIMIHLGKHINILSVLGAHTKNLQKRELLMITEYCRFGNILKFIRSHREEYIDQINHETELVDFRIGSDLYFDACHRTSSLFRVPSSASTSARRSVRYTRPPKPNRTESVQSDYTETDQITITGMTTLPEEDLMTFGNATMTSASGDETKRLNSNHSIENESRLRKIFTKDLIYWSYQVSRGMNYLTSKKVLHGDLACRNILLANNNIIKICDFGLARDIYKSDEYLKKSSGPLPVKWMAIESIRDKVFSAQSDVWSFGIVLWEMFSLGQSPYPGIPANEELYDRLEGGYRMDKPEKCPNVIYEKMTNCWKASPIQRPTFSDLENEFEKLLQENDRMSYLKQRREFDSNVLQLRSKRLYSESEENDYLAMMASPNVQIEERHPSAADHFDNCGYIPTSTGIQPSTGEDGYLAPNNELPLDEDGYLLASPTAL